MGLSVASKAGSTLSTGSSEGNMESLVDYHKVKFMFIFITLLSFLDESPKSPMLNVLTVLIVFLLIIIFVFVLCKRRSKTDDKKNVKEKDINPVYGDYYYQDGNRRQNIVEVSIMF